MPHKHKQGKSLGNLFNLRRPTEEDWTPDSVRINQLAEEISKIGERLSQLESIVNTILIPLQGSAKPAKPAKPVKPKEAKPKPETVELTEQDIVAKKIAEEKNQDAADRLQALLQDGQTRTMDEIVAALDISKGMFRRAWKLSNGLESTEYKEGGYTLYFMKK